MPQVQKYKIVDFVYSPSAVCKIYSWLSISSYRMWFWLVVIVIMILQTCSCAYIFKDFTFRDWMASDFLYIIFLLHFFCESIFLKKYEYWTDPLRKFHENIWDQKCYVVLEGEGCIYLCEQQQTAVSSPNCIIFVVLISILSANIRFHQICTSTYWYSIENWF